MKAYDTIIIGGGVIGNSIAYHLSKKTNKEIALIEKDYPLTGTSGATQAWVWVHSKQPESYAHFNKLSADLYPKLQEEIGDFEYKKQGGIVPLFKESEKKEALELVERQKQWNIPVQVLSKEEALSKEPELSQDIVGATYSEIDGSVHPFRLVEKYMKAAKKQGVQYYYYSNVTQVKKEKTMYEVTTSKGDTFCTKHLIIASGTWSEQVGKLLGVQIPVRPIRGQIAVTEQISPLFSHVIMGMRQLKDGEVLMDFTQQDVGFDKRNTFETIQETAKKAIKIIPALENATIVRCFAGLRAIPEDGFPIIGHVPGKENLLVACMHSGITLSPLVGEIISDLIVYGHSDIDYADYKIDRFY